MRFFLIFLSILLLCSFSSWADTTEVHSIAQVKIAPDGSIFVCFECAWNEHKVAQSGIINSEIANDWLAILRVAMETERRVEFTYPDGYSFSTQESSISAISLRLANF